MLRAIAESHASEVSIQLASETVSRFCRKVQFQEFINDSLNMLLRRTSASTLRGFLFHILT